MCHLETLAVICFKQTTIQRVGGAVTLMFIKILGQIKYEGEKNKIIKIHRTQ